MARVAVAPHDAQKIHFFNKNNAKMSLFFCSEPAREAYSGHSGDRSAPPPRECPLLDKFLARPMLMNTSYNVHNLPRTPTRVSWTVRASMRLAAPCFPSSLLSSRTVVGRPKHLHVTSACGEAVPARQPVNATNWSLLAIPETSSISNTTQYRSTWRDLEYKWV